MSPRKYHIEQDYSKIGSVISELPDILFYWGLETCHVTNVAYQSKVFF